ncbi:MAG: hypothetical protein MI924_07800, partial [Chloroflexales bacterium]|nr:hypothetical protein [Chloroflexales bacterium]
QHRNRRTSPPHLACFAEVAQSSAIQRFIHFAITRRGDQVQVLADTLHRDLVLRFRSAGRRLYAHRNFRPYIIEAQPTLSAQARRYADGSVRDTPRPTNLLEGSR